MEPKTIKDFLSHRNDDVNTTSSSSSNKVMEITMLLFSYVNQYKIYHWALIPTSIGLHNVVGEFADGLFSNIDRLAENILSNDELNDLNESELSGFIPSNENYLRYSPENKIKTDESFDKTLKSLFVIFSDDEGIKNVLGDIAEDYNKMLYLTKGLKK